MTPRLRASWLDKPTPVVLTVRFPIRHLAHKQTPTDTGLLCFLRNTFMINHQSGAAFMRCCSSVESRYSHSSSPNRRSETWPSQILSAKSFNISERSRYPTHKHTLSLLFGGAAESPLKTQQTLHLLLSLRTQLHGGAIQQNYCLCVCACVFVYMWTLCCVLRFDITAWKNHPHLKVIIPFWEQSLVRGGYWESVTAKSSLNAVEWLAPQLQMPELKQNAWMEPCCSGRARNLNYPVQKKHTHLC